MKINRHKKLVFLYKIHFFMIMLMISIFTIFTRCNWAWLKLHSMGSPVADKY